MNNKLIKTSLWVIYLLQKKIKRKQLESKWSGSEILFFCVFYILITVILESPAKLVGQPGQDWELCRSQNHPQILWSINQTLVPKLWTRKLKNAFIKYHLDLLLALISNNNEKKHDLKYMLNIYGIIFIY